MNRCVLGRDVCYDPKRVRLCASRRAGFLHTRCLQPCPRRFVHTHVKVQRYWEFRRLQELCSCTILMKRQHHRYRRYSGVIMSPAGTARSMEDKRLFSCCPYANSLSALAGKGDTDKVTRGNKQILLCDQPQWTKFIATCDGIRPGKHHAVLWRCN
jgi:hypothetical protein